MSNVGLLVQVSKSQLMSVFMRTGWIRLGITLSVGWFLIVLAYAAYDYNSVNSKEGGWETLGKPGEIVHVSNKFQSYLTLCAPKENSTVMSCLPRVENIALLAIVPTVTAWIFVVTLGNAVTWVIAGFQRDKIQRGGSGFWTFRHSSDCFYLKPNRLADVLSLIQVLALDENSHRSEDGLQEALQGTPRSGSVWTEVASQHPELFRVRAEGTHRISLVARHVTPKNVQGLRTLPADYAANLQQLAIELHDREVRRVQSWHVYIPIAVAVTAGVFTMFGIFLSRSL